MFIVSPSVLASDFAKLGEEIRKTEYHRISPAINRINTALSDPSLVSDTELARVCEMSVSNFRRVFKLETGLSPKAYITKARMDYAEYLLKNTNMTILQSILIVIVILVEITQELI